MSQYAGVKSLDAEITLNLSDGTINLDYYSNGSLYNSNTSAVLKSDWRSASGRTRFKYALWWEYLKFVMPFALIFYLPAVTYLGSKGKLSQKFQYEHQKFLKWYCTNVDGIKTQYVAGRHDGTIVKFHVDTNIWFEYLLNGDYQKKIRKVSLLREYRPFLKHGKFEEIRQDGWNIVFEFSEPLKEGFCEIHYVR